MKAFESVYWCHACKKGFTEDEVVFTEYAPAVLYGDNAHPTEWNEPVCPDCGVEVSEAEQCDGCHEIAETCYPYRNIRVCAECLPVHMLSDALSNAKFSIALQFVTLLGMTFDGASERVKEVFNDYDFTEE